MLIPKKERLDFPYNLKTMYIGIGNKSSQKNITMSDTREKSLITLIPGTKTTE